MTIANRMRRIREVRGFKQTNVASAMQITQQAYSCMEKGANNARLDTLRKFCAIMNVELSFLVAIDLPITEETMARFGSTKYNEFLCEYKKLEQKLEIFDELLRGKTATLLNHQIGDITSEARRA